MPSVKQSVSPAFLTSAPLLQNNHCTSLRSISFTPRFQPCIPSSSTPTSSRRQQPINNASSDIPSNPTVSSSNSTPTSTSVVSQPSKDKDVSEIILRLFRRELEIPPATQRAIRTVFGNDTSSVNIEQETCFNIALTSPLTESMQNALHWLLAETFDPQGLSDVSHFEKENSSSIQQTIIEVGPRLNFQTAWSSNAVTICNACSIPNVIRLERSRRYRLTINNKSISDTQKKDFATQVHDRMTETIYQQPLSTFNVLTTAAPSYTIDVIGSGAKALRTASETDGLGFDDQDIDYYVKLFQDMGRNPTNVELFDLAQSNSEHSRHWFFKGKLIVDGKPTQKHLFDMVRDTLKQVQKQFGDDDNSVIAFADNSSTIRSNHSPVPTLVPALPGTAGPMRVAKCDRDVLFTAETHNFPSGVAPFPGAETGTGGRIRDTAATGIGSLVNAATAGYSVGHLHIPSMKQPWESEAAFQYPGNLASPLDILIGASDGASDYGNKFGEPVINGFARSYGLRLSNGQRREYVKPIMFSGGIGQMEHCHAHKGRADNGLLVVKVGGPAYRIGMGGGAASSMMHGDNRDDLDFNAVQRGDAEMAQKVYRVLRACVEMGEFNPIVSIHDQGAGGNCNVVKELIYPSGATIHLRNVWVADTSLSALEIWGAEYQEQFGLLLRPEHEHMFHTLCRRENVVPAILGTIDNSGRITLWDEVEQRNVVDLDLEAVLGDLPQKTFTDKRLPQVSKPLEFPRGISVADVLRRVLSLMSVGSKRFLTTKVDRSVSGLVAQQQCVGPLQLPLCGFAVTARSHLSRIGAVTAIGERPTLTSLDPAAMARMSVAEMLTNMAGARVTARRHIKCSANWMWAAKLDGDCASLLDAATAMSDIMCKLSIAVDGGKDSLSMAARCPNETESVRAPGTLVISGYCTMSNVTEKLTPDLKRRSLQQDTDILHVDIANGQRRLGGSAAALVFNQLGDTSPDIDSSEILSKAFDVMQTIITHENVHAYHDISDGGLLTSLLEMGFAGNCGLDVQIDSDSLPFVSSTVNKTIATLFAEEAGMLIEVSSGTPAQEIMNLFKNAGVPCSVVARTRTDFQVNVQDGSNPFIVDADIRQLRDAWEATSFALDALQANDACVTAEREGLRNRTGPSYVVPWTPRPSPYFDNMDDNNFTRSTVSTSASSSSSNTTNTKKSINNNVSKTTNTKNIGQPRVAILREEGSNGDREMAAAFHLAGFEVWDICTRDIAESRVGLSSFSGVAFVGGFSFADVLDSAKGWAGVARLNKVVQSELEMFFSRSDTFSLGVCNGCQLMALLKQVPFPSSSTLSSLSTGNTNDVVDDDTKQPRFVRNVSGRYESRFTTVSILPDSPSIMLRGMSGGRLGVWVAHGEGRTVFPDESILQKVINQNLAPIRYVADDGKPTETYPFNPNGSVDGIAALCSPDGRHLAMMPHPERCVQLWQWPYVTDEVSKSGTSPWLTMFQNAREWVKEVGYQ